MVPKDPTASEARRYVLGPVLRFLFTCVAFFLWILVTSILPAGRPENIVRGTPKFNAVEAFGTPLLFWLVGSVWVLRATALIRASNIGARELFAMAAIVIGLGATIVIVAFFWWVLLASGPTR